jgi:nucleoside-diphosphate-sugar epimerase
MRIAVTGAYGLSGRYIACRLLDLRHEVITLTNSPHHANPSGESIKAFPYNFSQPHESRREYGTVTARHSGGADPSAPAAKASVAAADSAVL